MSFDVYHNSFYARNLRTLKVSKFQNEFMTLSFLPKYEPNIVRISALHSATPKGRNPYNFYFIIWEKDWLHKFILKFTDKKIKIRGNYFNFLQFPNSKKNSFHRNYLPKYGNPEPANLEYLWQKFVYFPLRAAIKKVIQSDY